MTTTVKAIIEAKRTAGEDAFLWLRPSGDCYLYAEEEHSVDGEELGAWELDPIEREQLIETGLVDCQD